MICVSHIYPHYKTNKVKGLEVSLFWSKMDAGVKVAGRYTH